MEFSERVYAVVSRIPRGKVSTYKAVAKALGTKAYRGVGQALRHNPYAPVVPCHRVIREDRSIGGFAGMNTGPKIREKILLLEDEGVRFVNGRVREENVLRIIPPT